MSGQGYLNQSLDSSRNDVPFNQNQYQQFNFNQEVTKQLEYTTSLLKKGVLVQILGTVSVFFLAFCNIRSNYFIADSVVLLILGIAVLIMSFYIVKFYQNKDASPQKKKHYLIYLTCISICIAAASGSYLANAKVIEWCNYVVTFNGPVNANSINRRLNQIAICKGKSYHELEQQVKQVIHDKCGNSSFCENNDFYLTNFQIVLGTFLMNLLIYFVYQILMTIYMLSKLAQAQMHAIEVQSQYYNNLRQQQGTTQSNRYQNNPPQIYQAQLAPAFFTNQSSQDVVVGQPIYEESSVYQHPQHNAQKVKGYQNNNMSNSNL